MADRRQRLDATNLPTHASKPSLDTNASGIAESAISYSAFPEPPSSIPSTPVRSVFGESPTSSSIGHFLSGPSRYTSPQVQTPSILSSPIRYSRTNFGEPEPTRGLTSERVKRGDDTNSASPSTISPFDWHEGASSIGVDAAEDRLLPTSFITTLLQENAGPRGPNRASYASDAISGISEMTYPPKYHTNSLHENSAFSSRAPSHRQSYRGPLPRPVGGRAPSSYNFHHSGRRHSSVPDRHNAAQAIVTSSSSSPAGSLSSDDPAMKRSVSVHSQSTLVAEPEREGKYGAKLAPHSEVDESDDSGYPADANTNSSSGYATSQTNITQLRPLRNDISAPRKRESMHSTRSAVPSVISSLRRALTWRRRKPLPPVPIIPHMTIATEREHRRKEEETPLPVLVSRADRLHGLLEKGYHPHHSVSEHPSKMEPINSSFDDAETIARYHSEHVNRYPSSPPIIAWVKERKMWVIVGIFVLVAVAAIGAAIGVTVEGNKVKKTSCPSNLGGVSCNLNATCVCTTTASPCGDPVAQSVLDLIPIMNDRLSTNITASTVYDSLWLIQGSVQGTSCVQQADMVDVSSALDIQTHPNRTQWAQIALLWTLTQTQDSPPVTQLQKFIEKAPWTRLGVSDGPVVSAGSDFTTLVAGFSYDFAAQTITPGPSNFVNDGQPLNEQIARVDTNILSSLDRMYSYAVASSKQRDNALLKYWTTVLHQRESTLNQFKAAFSASPIILPLDGTSQSIRGLYNSSSSFPPPAACYPGLGANQRELVTTVEENVFNLSSATATTFDSSCLPLHPTYGILDVLRLRLPFLDSRNNVSRQGVVLKSDVAPRAILAVGEAFAAIPGQTNVTRDHELLVDPRGYGTTAFANHVILQYLSSVSINTANAIVNHILSPSTPIPLPPNPVQEPSLFPLDSIPSLEVAVFGEIKGSDAGSYASAFTSSSGSLFFGSDDGNAFRALAIGRGGKIAWTENATSPEVVYDDNFSDSIFNQTWLATSSAISQNVQNVGLPNITNSFRLNQRFRP